MAPIIPLIPPLLVICKALLAVVGTGAATAALEGVVDAVTKQKHEKQLQECLERAFKQTKKQFKWSIKDKTAFSNFKASLVSFAGTFEQDSLRQLLGTAIGTQVSDIEVETWIDNLIKQITLDEHNELFKYLLLNNIIVDSTNQKDSVSQPETKTNYILTSSASIYDNPEIICRDAFIDDLLQLLSSGHKRIQITGMGGLGKTETLTKLFAKLAADEQHSNFDHIAFIRFSGDLLSDIESQVDYPRQYLGLQGVEAAKRFLHDLCGEKNVLLCIDDIRANQEIVSQDNPIIQYLRSLDVSVVLAARVGFPDFEQNDLSFLSTKACVELFEKKFGRSVSDATDIAILIGIIENRAGKNTLIINRLGNMAKDHKWTISVLERKLDEKNFSFQKGIVDEELLQQEINKLYQVNDKLGEDEKNILEAFAIFPAVPLAADLCVEWLHEDAGVDEDRCILLLNKLAEETWLEQRLGADDTATFSMHQLVRTSVQGQSDNIRTFHLNLVARCATSLYNSVNTYDLANSFAILSFAKSVFSATSHASIPHGQLCGEIGYFYNEVAEYSTSLEWYLKTLEVCADIKSDDPPNVANIYNNIALIHKHQGNYDLALEWYQKALSASNPDLEDDLTFIALVHSNIGIVYNLQGEHDLALEQYNKSLEYSHQAHDTDSIAVAKTYTNIASVYSDQGDYILALYWNLMALEIKERKLDENHPSTATSYNNIALIYKSLGACDLSYEWNQKALRIRELIFGENHPETAMSYCNIAYLYLEQGRTTEAIELFKRALEVYEKRLGPDHQDTIKVKKELLRQDS